MSSGSMHSDTAHKSLPPALTKRQLDIIADIIRQLPAHFEDELSESTLNAQAATRVVAEHFATRLRGYNSNFDRKRFLSNCEV